ncbi:hypothetical protein G5T42_06090 [Microbacterium sp. 4R-513]|uniref:hypothetical protein n=1 Tax=Microbacterium sp. 4R-513 TaxID=2567934 RepID=UPI0013E16D1C|nr:hypothetical protein [Microbacterium sp. 4R-513]QIG39110.1 hypothetical protein G5T42_06090 [Microbacterium sp. 4R-513]
MGIYAVRAHRTYIAGGICRMPVITTRGTDREVGKEPVELHAYANTRPKLPAEEAVAYINAAIDLIALGCLAATGLLTFEPRPTNPGADRQVRVDTGADHYFDVTPPFAALSTAREELLVIRSVSYSNPLDIVASAKVGKDAASSIIAFLDYFNVAKARKRLASEEASKAELERIVSDVTLEATVQEKYILLERLILENEAQQLQNAIAREELEQRRLENEERRMQLAQRITSAQNLARQRGYGVPLWSNDEALEFADNVRLTASVELADSIHLTTRLGTD